MNHDVENFITEAEATINAMLKVAESVEAGYALDTARLLDRFGESKQNKELKNRLELLRRYMDATKVIMTGALSQIKHLRFQAIVHEQNEKKLSGLRIYVAHLEKAIDNPEAITKFYNGLKTQICRDNGGTKKS